MLHNFKIFIIAIGAIIFTNCSTENNNDSIVPPIETIPPKPVVPTTPEVPNEHKATYLYEYMHIEENYFFRGNFFRNDNEKMDDIFKQKIWELTPDKVDIENDQATVTWKNKTSKTYKIIWKNNVGSLKNSIDDMSDYIVMSEDKKQFAIYLNLYNFWKLGNTEENQDKSIYFNYGLISFSDFYNKLPENYTKTGRFIRAALVFKSTQN